MKKKTLLVAIVTLLLLIGCGQPKPTTMELVPFTSQAWSIRGVAPVGWMEVNPGHFSGDEMPLNQLLHEFYPGMMIEIVTQTVTLPRLGLDALPEPTGTNESGMFTWDLYAMDIEDPNVGQIMVDLTMTETTARVYVVALVTGVDDHDALREAVFVPAWKPSNRSCLTKGIG